MKFYFDDPEVGPDRETSHPDFVSKFTAEIYYDVLDEFSPFGNDDGADALSNLEDWYRDTDGEEDIMEWLFEYIDDFGFEYASRDVYLLTDKSKLEAIRKKEPFLLQSMDNTIIAAAFGQYKMTGEINEELKQAALLSIARTKMIPSQDRTPLLNEFTKNYSQMESDLAKL